VEDLEQAAEMVNWYRRRWLIEVFFRIVVFDPEEWQAAWIVKHRSEPPAEPPKLGEMVRLIAGFGGFLGRKSDGVPGSKAIWEGMEKVRYYAVGIEVGKAVYAQSDSSCG
jgi:hypothetical protein